MVSLTSLPDERQGQVHDLRFDLGHWFEKLAPVEMRDSLKVKQNPIRLIPLKIQHLPVLIMNLDLWHIIEPVEALVILHIEVLLVVVLLLVLMQNGHDLGQGQPLVGVDHEDLMQ